MDREVVKEAIRRDIIKNHDLLEIARANNCQRLGRLVDKDVLTKCVLSDYRMMNRNLARTLGKHGDLDEIEKFRGKYGNAKSKRGEGIQTAEIPLDKPLEMIYFEYYGENFSGGDIPDTPKNYYICPHCNQKYIMAPALLPMHCSKCKCLTPIGRLIEDGYYKRW